MAILGLIVLAAEGERFVIDDVLGEAVRVVGLDVVDNGLEDGSPGLSEDGLKPAFELEEGEWTAWVAEESSDEFAELLAGLPQMLEWPLRVAAEILSAV